MKALYSLLWLCAGAAIFVHGCIQLEAQKVIPAHESNYLLVTIAMEKERVHVGESPIVTMVIENVSDETINLNDCMDDPRVWVQGAHGEPPTTYRERFSTGRLLPGEPDLACTLNMTYSVAPGASITRHIILDSFYDLREPGKYTVYVEFPSREGLLRTDPIKFEILAAEPVSTKDSK
jgi:hypothetical protein